MIDVKRREPRIGEDVRVHMDLNRGVLSIKSMEPGDDYNLVLCRAREPVLLEDCSFVVQKGTWRTLVERGVRRVCAYVRGKFAGREACRGTQVRYNPFESMHFTIDGEPMPRLEAERASLRITDTGYEINAETCTTQA
jgi:hypothetical protein